MPVYEITNSIIFMFEQTQNLKRLDCIRGCSYGGELAWLSGLARLGEMIFIPRSHGILYLSSIKKFVVSLEKDYLISIFYNKVT